MIALGDITERCLRFFGITKEWVQAVTDKEDCGCAKRQAAMNQWGYVWQHRLAMPLYWLRYRWQAICYGAFGQRLYMAGYYLWMAVRVLFWGR
jgi:hypothetical protein